MLHNVIRVLKDSEEWVHSALGIHDAPNSQTSYFVLSNY